MLCGREKGAAKVTSLGKNSEFAEVDINNMSSLKGALSGNFILFNCYPQQNEITSLINSFRFRYSDHTCFICRCGSRGSCCGTFSAGGEMHCFGSCY